MSVNFQNGYQNAYYGTYSTGSRSTSGTDNVFGENKKSNKVATVAAVGVGALAVGATVYALVKGKKIAGKDAKLGEVLSKGFKSLGGSIKSGWNKVCDGVKKLFNKGEKVAAEAEQSAQTAQQTAQKVVEKAETTTKPLSLDQALCEDYYQYEAQLKAQGHLK